MISRGLTIRQPWAYAILFNGKLIENRSWKPPKFIIGERIWLHTSARLHKSEIVAYEKAHGSLEDGTLLPLGCIVGHAVVAGCIEQPPAESPNLWPVSTVRAAQLLTPEKIKKWFVGDYGWVFDNITPLEYPIPHTGALGLWKLSIGKQREYNFYLEHGARVKDAHYASYRANS